MKFTQLVTIIPAALSAAIICLAPTIAWTRGGGHGGSHGGRVSVHGYTRKDGTYVAPYTRSAPGGGSGYSGGSTYTNSPDTPTPTVPDSAIEPLSQPTASEASPPDSFNFPQASCGDKPTSANDTWYPVFVDGGNLEKIRSQYCADAVSTVREDTKVETVQVASFNNRERALKFAQAVKGDVGKPTSPDDAKHSTEREVIPKTAAVPVASPLVSQTSSSAQQSSVSLAPSPLSSPPVSPTSSAQPSQANMVKGGLGWPFLALLTLGVGLGIGLKVGKPFRKV